MHLLGISRGKQFSPNMTDNDTAIFRAVIDVLEKSGCKVDRMSEDEFCAVYKDHLDQVKADAIFGMYRGLETINLLDELEMMFHIPAINPCWGIHNAIRKNLTLVLQTSGVPIPQTQIVDANFRFDESVSYPCWLKRGDACAQVREDVVYCDNSEQAQAALQAFQRRGIVRDIVVCEHLVGDLIKFYGVEGTDFFQWDYASRGYSKFGLEAHNGVEHEYPFSVNTLHALATRTAENLKLPIYGGDAVVSATGEIRIIDFNDWPSFSRCREKASVAIAKKIIKEYEENRK